MTDVRQAGDGRDESGRDLEVTIRIGPDGRLYFADLPPDLLPVAVAVLPENESLRVRADRASRYGQEEPT
jgi:hypothetical protein